MGNIVPKISCSRQPPLFRGCTKQPPKTCLQIDGGLKRPLMIKMNIKRPDHYSSHKFLFLAFTKIKWRITTVSTTVQTKPCFTSCAAGNHKHRRSKPTKKNLVKHDAIYNVRQLRQRPLAAPC